MAMIECAECGAKISSEAKVCPTCGKENKLNVDKATVDSAKYVIFSIVVGLIVFYFLTH